MILYNWCIQFSACQCYGDVVHLVYAGFYLSVFLVMLYNWCIQFPVCQCYGGVVQLLHTGLCLSLLQ